MRYYLGVDWADQTQAVWVVDERGTKITARTVPHTAEGIGGHAWKRGACRPEDHTVPSPRRLTARLSRSARERHSRIQRKWSPGGPV